MRRFSTKTEHIIKKAGVGAVSLLLSGFALGNPILGNISSGNVSIHSTPNTTNINQSSQQAIINWQSFNIGAHQATHFIQPAGGVALNRISAAQGASQIYGVLTATGQIILINPAGIYFGPSAFVNVGGLIATTANITDKDFLNHQYQFLQDPSYHGAIINDGNIIAHDHGLVALVGGAVENNGLIRANLGHVVLASGAAFTMNFAGNDLINFAITKPTTTASVDRNGKKLKYGVSNTGTLEANGGSILVTASAAEGVLDRAINMEGVAQAQSVSQHNGTIVLSGGTDGNVYVNATLQASGKHQHQTGGNVTITGKNIYLDTQTDIDVSGDAGGGNILIGGDAHGAGPLTNASTTVLAPGATLTANAINTGNGGNVVLWSNDSTSAAGNISAKGGALSGNGGYVETSGGYLNLNNVQVDTSAAHGTTGTWLLDPTALTIEANGGTNSNILGPETTPFAQVYTGDPDQSTSIFDVNNLETDLASNNVTIQTSGLGTAPGSGDITVASNITWSSAFSLTLSAFKNIIINAGVTISNTTSALASLVLQTNNSNGFDIGSGGGLVTNNGTIDMSGPVNIFYNPTSTAYTPTPYVNTGAGAVTAYMYINTSSELADVMGNTAAWSQDLALSTDVDAEFITPTAIGTTATPFTGNFNGQGYIISDLNSNVTANSNGLLFGVNSGTIQNIGVEGNLTDQGNEVGLLSGLNNAGGVIKNSFVMGTLTDNSTTASLIGGITGLNNGTISNSYSDESLTSGTNDSDVGNFVGGNGGTISNSYSIGNVVGTAASNVGGFVGNNEAGGVITDAYSTGQAINGFAGFSAGTINDSFFDSTTAGTGAGGNGAVAGCFTGTCPNGGTANLSALSTYSGAGWSIGTNPATDNWLIYNGSTRPLLAMEYNPNISTVHNLQLININNTTLTDDYNLPFNLNITGMTGNPHDIWGGGNFLSLGTNSNPYSGTFNGNTKTIIGFTLNSTNTTAPIETALFSNTNGIIENLGMLNVSVTGLGGTIAGLAANNEGTLMNDYVTGVVSSSNADTAVIGGVVADNNGTLTNDYNDAQVFGGATNSVLGGLVGVNETGGTINTSYADSVVINEASATSGDLVGLNQGTINNSYSTGPVFGFHAVVNNSELGSFVGENDGTINMSYSIGAVLAAGAPAANVAGFVGVNTGTINDSFFDTGTTGYTVGTNGGTVNNLQGGCFNGACGVNLSEEATYTAAGWDFTNTWGIINGESYPYLLAFYPTTPRAITGSSPGPVVAVNFLENGGLGFGQYSGANDAYYVLTGTNAIFGNYALSDGADLVGYTSTGTPSTTVITVPTGGGSFSGLDLVANTLSIGGVAAGAMSTADLSTAEGGFFGPYILYTVAGNNITVGTATNPNVNVVLSSLTNFDSLGNITAIAGGTGNYTFNGSVVSNASTISNNGDQTYNASVTLNPGTTVLDASGGTLDIATTIGGVNNNLELVGNIIEETGAGVLNTITSLITDSVAGTVLNGANTTIASLSATNTGSGGIGFTNTGALSLAGVSQSGGSFVLDNTGAVTQTGPVVVDGASSIVVGANPITLTNAGNDFVGALSLSNSGANNVAVTNAGLLILGASTVGTGTLNLNGVGLSQVGVITQAASAGDVSLIGNAGAIALSNALNDFTGNVTLQNSGANDVAFGNTGTLNLAASTVGSGVTNIVNTGALNVNGTFTSTGGAVNMTTVSPDANSRVLTVDGDIDTNGGAISLVGANNTGGTDSSLVINNPLDTSPGAGGVLSLGGGVELNATPVVGSGNINLQGSGEDLTLTSATLGTNVDIAVKRYIELTGALDTTGGASIILQGDSGNVGVGGVYIESGASINSSGGLTIIGSSLSGLAGADAGSGIDIAAGSTVNAAGPIVLTENVGNSNIDINGGLGASGANSITVTPSSTGSINVGANVSTGGGNITFNGPVILNNAVTTAAALGTISFLDGVTGNQNLTVDAQISNLIGQLTVNNLVVNGNGPNPTLNLDDALAQNWNINSLNTGTITGLTGVGTFDFTGIANIDAGSANNSFTFADNASLSGLLNGGNLNQTNELNYQAYTTNIALELIGNVNSGQTLNQSNDIITNFTNINEVAANNTVNNNLILPNKQNTIDITGPETGFITDPLSFSGFSTFTSTSGKDAVVLPAGSTPSNSVTVDGSPLTFVNFTFAPVPTSTPGVNNVITGSSTPPVFDLDVASIVGQPTEGSIDNSEESNWLNLDLQVAELIDSLDSQTNAQMTQLMSQMKLEPYCSK